MLTHQEAQVLFYISLLLCWAISAKPGFSLLIHDHLQVHMVLSMLSEHLRNAFKVGVGEYPQRGKEKSPSPHALLFLWITSFVPTS